jgi:hypothetical protein
MSHHIRSTHRIRVAAPVDVALKFFTPAGEELWAEGWAPRYLEPADGRTRAGMVFTTGADAQFTIWQMLEFDRVARVARYVRTTPALRTGQVEVRCRALDPGSTEVEVCYDLVALTAAGEESLRDFEGGAFAAMIDGWADRIATQLPVLRHASIR